MNATLSINYTSIKKKFFLKKTSFENPRRPPCAVHACLSGHRLYLFCLRMTMRWCTPEEPVFRRPGYRQQTSSSVKAGEEGEGEGKLQPPVVFTPTSSVRLRLPTRSHVSLTDSAMPVLLLRKLWPNSSLCSGNWLLVRKQSAFKVSQSKGLSWFVFLPSPPLHTLPLAIPTPTPTPQKKLNPITRQVSWFQAVLGLKDSWRGEKTGQLNILSWDPS